MTVLEMLIEHNQQRLPHELQQTWHMQVNEMGQCLHIYRSSFGLKHIPAPLAEVVQTALLRTVSQPRQTDEERYMFTELCRFGAALGDKFKPASQTIHATLARVQGGSTLPNEVVAILNSSEIKDRGERKDVDE